ncbi:MAG: EAL domain-containing protein, partial [Gammaproteobacteria bacterium]
PDGFRFHAQLDYLRLDKIGDTSVVRMALLDISERKRAEEELRISAIAFETREGMMVTDTNGTILRVNQAFTRMTGYRAAEIMGLTPRLLRSGRHDPVFYQCMWQSLLKYKHWQGEIWNRNKNGKIYAEWLSISAVSAPDGTITHYVGSLSDITQNIEAAAEIHRLAYYDPLTQLPNRRLLQDRLEQALTASNRSNHYGAIVFLDLDNFKLINDLHGHAAGDQLLITLAKRLHTCVRAGDTIARLAGDEFVILLEDLSHDAEAAASQVKQVADKVQALVTQPYLVSEQEYSCTTSIGISLFHDNEVNVEKLLRRADLALYQSKSAGRNTLRFFDPAMQLLQDQRNSMVNDLRQACPLQQLHLYYQPLLDNQHQVIGAEALLRWRHPERGLVTPGEFIQVAEESGLILDIGAWVLKTACLQIKAWETHDVLRQLKISVNASARQFRQPGFVDDVQKILSQTGADPSRLKLELTESLILSDITATLEKMHALKAQGIGLSLDDFGTGYSSLSYLTRLPLNQLKIDKAFVLNLPGNYNDAVITQTIITMARNLGLSVIAEGVETEAQGEFLERHGCHRYQGYLYSRPLPLEDFEKFVLH